MKYAALLLLILFTSFTPLETKVYICGSGGAKKYHFKETCRGLKSCNHSVNEVTLSQAKGLGLTLCGWED